jgi:Domain of unknown function (DUF4173)
VQAPREPLRLRRAEQRQGGWRWAQAVRAWSPPLAGALVFLGLFGFANPMIEGWWREAFTYATDSTWPAPARVALWLAAGLGLWLYARLRPARRLGRMVHATAAREPDPRWVLRCLLAFNAVFAVQNGCDLAVLGLGMALPDGMSYASYAHRGAYPLLAAALLAAGFVLIAFRPGGSSESDRLRRGLVLAFLAQVTLLTIAALLRLELYLDAYGYTRWRLAALAWMALVAGGLVLIAVRIAGRKSGRWLIEANAWAAALVLMAFALGDGDGLIARRNVALAQRPEAPVPLDLPYLVELGPAALPALHELRRGRGPERQLDAAIRTVQAQLDAELADWRNWTWRRWRLGRR